MSNKPVKKARTQQEPGTSFTAKEQQEGQRALSRRADLLARFYRKLHGEPETPGEEPVRDFRIDGPAETQQIIREHPACATAPNGTGSRCTCDFSCANYWLRARGYKQES